MWRLLSGIPRALRQHINGSLRSTTNTRAEEEKGDGLVTNVTILKTQTSPETLVARYQTSRGQKENGSGPDKEQAYSGCDFSKFLHGQQCALEAIGWGAAVILGIHLKPSLCPTPSDKERKHCLPLLYQIAYALPKSKSAQAKLAVIDGDKKLHTDSKLQQFETEEEDSEGPLQIVLNDFQDMCKKYSAMGQNIEALQCAEEKNYADAVSYWKESSNLGYAKAQFNLGICYETGQGIKQSLRKARKCYQYAAAENHQEALYNLALIHLKGEGGVTKNMPLAITLLEKAARLGLSQAQTYLGVYYTEEETRNMKKAASFFEAAASQNDPEAQYFLAICYEQGMSVEQNECRAADLYSQAAQSGHDGAIYNLGTFHEYGLGGLPEDKVSAVELYKKAAAAGNPSAQDSLDRLQAEAAIAQWKDPDISEKASPKIATPVAEPRTTLHASNSSPTLHASNSSPTLTESVQDSISQFELMKLKSSFRWPSLSDLFPDKSAASNGRVQFQLGVICDVESTSEPYQLDTYRGLSYPISGCANSGMSRSSTLQDLNLVSCS